MLDFKKAMSNILFLGPYRVLVTSIKASTEEFSGGVIAEVQFMDRDDLDWKILNQYCKEFSITHDSLAVALVDYDKITEHPFNSDMGKCLYT